MVPCRDARFCVSTMHSTYVTNFSHITNNSQPGYRNVLQLRPIVETQDFASVRLSRHTND